jgi:hypothetical protein
MGRLPHAQGQPALVAFDQEGLIFAACARIQGQGPGQPDRHVLKLFDCRQFGSVVLFWVDWCCWMGRGLVDQACSNLLIDRPTQTTGPAPLRRAP